MDRLASKSQPMFNLHIRNMVSQIYRRHAEAYEAKYGKSFCNDDTDSGYTQRVTPNINASEIEPYIKGIAPDVTRDDVLIFAYDQGHQPFLTDCSGVIITRTTLYWRTPCSPFKHSVPLTEIQRFAPESSESIFRYQQVLAQEFEMNIYYKDPEKQEYPDVIWHFPGHFTDFLNEVLAYLQSNQSGKDRIKQPEIVKDTIKAPVTPATTQNKKAEPAGKPIKNPVSRRLSDEEVGYAVSAIYRKYELYYAEEYKMNFTEPEHGERVVMVVPNILADSEGIESYVKYLAPDIKPSEVLIFARSNPVIEMVCIGSGVLITRHKIYWKPGFFAPLKYSADLSEIEEFIYEYNNPRREKTYDMYLRRKNGTLLDALEGADRINHFSKHHTNFLNEVLAFLQSNP